MTINPSANNKRTFVSFPITDFQDCKMQLLCWADQFPVSCFLDNHNYPFSHNSYECLVGAGVSSQVTAASGEAFELLHQFVSGKKDWIFGHLGFDLKNELEALQSNHPDGIDFPDLFFFVPELVILLKNNVLSIGVLNGISSQSIYDDIRNTSMLDFKKQPPVIIKSRFSKQEYLAVVQQLRRHILRGDCYEVNFCQEFFSDNTSISPLQIYFSLSNISPNPFAAYYKINDKYLCCASPERYLKKDVNRIISQPIKGTWTRDLDSQERDLLNKKTLWASGKERAENVMIVDLVRNDLSRVCEEGSIKVEELYGIYSYPQVHQMISTISGTIRKDIHWINAIKASFPVGSMTGAPKKSVLELLEKYEKTKRGLFSGAIGYITPDADFDFNVVIRSIFYNESNKYLCYQVGSAITFSSDPEKEYEECMLKVAAIREALA